MANSARIDELRKKFDENPRRFFAPLANEYRKSGDLAQAVFILEEYLPQQPGHISGHIVYGQTLFELGRDEEAKRVFEAALVLDPENLIALRHLGHISRQAGDFDAARSWYQRLLEADPRDAEIEQLLGSLDAAAQAHAAGLAPAPPVESAPLPPPMPEVVDDSPLQVEHLVQQDAPGAPASPRPSTHPLAPPPLSFASPEPEAASEAAEPPPLPAAATTEAAHEEAEEELLDLNDFSFDSPSMGFAATPSPPQAPTEHVADASPVEEMPPPLPEDAPSSPAEASEPAHEEVASDAEPRRVPPNVPLGFEPFSGLESNVDESKADNVAGLESYEFESPGEPVAEVSDDVGSFYMESTDSSTEPEPVEHTPGFESVEMEFATEITAESATPETSDHVDAPEPQQAEESSEVESADVVARATMPIASTPVATTPVAELHEPPAPREQTPVVASTPVAASTAPSEDAASAPVSSDGDAEGDAFATETMAKLYLNQGHLESALGIYRTLAAKRPDDESLRRQVEEIEDRVQRRRREPTPSAPIEAAAIEAASDTPGTAEPTPAIRAGLPTIRDFLLGIIRRGATREAPPTSANGGTIDALFGVEAEDEGALDDDLAAADTLAQAFSPETGRDPMRGHPAREAATELSLDRVFRQPTPAHAGESAAGGFSFDQFFAGERADDSETRSADTPGDPHDIEQFNAWLNGLKKS